MTRLAKRIAGLIGTLGPIPVNEYMALCLFDAAEGYYTTREPFGAAGDFVTAPEISQMFGELIAVWLYDAWRTIGSPAKVTIAEIGPGRGTLMKDMLRTFSRLNPALSESATFAMIETSPRLTDIQKSTLGAAAEPLTWHDSIATLDDFPLLIVGNELFDAVPVRQFVRTVSGWRERTVGLDDSGALRFMAGAGSIDATLLPVGAADAGNGVIAEVAPARLALMEAICGRIAAFGGAGLFIDYGHLEPGLGDTLQAVRKHAREDVLANPGEADLTAHVDFAALAGVTRRLGLDVRLGAQGDFLLRMGLLERAGSLGTRADAQARQEISDAVERLAGQQAMGTLFKVMEILPGRTGNARSAKPA